MKPEARRRNVNARDARKKFQPAAAQRIWIKEQLHPKIFENFSRQCGNVPLQHDACPTFAMEK